MLGNIYIHSEKRDNYNMSMNARNHTDRKQTMSVFSYRQCVIEHQKRNTKSPFGITLYTLFNDSAQFII